MSKYKVPENLIDQVQILLRKEALFDSFNPNGSSIPPPPTIEDAIITSDDQLRCEHCKGELLRGLESIICVYCGRGKQEENPRQAIAFKSTLGFGWLLHSLRLDGSESVGPPSGGTQSDRGQSSLKDEIALSDFLNMELKWPDESKRLGMINEERSLTLVGVDLNDLVPEGSSDNTSSAYNEKPVTSKKTEIKETALFHGQRNLNLFEETKSSQPMLRSNEGENDKAFSGWEAEFQSAAPDAKGPFTDNTSHIDSVKGHGDLEKSTNISSSHSHPRSDLTSEDLDVNFAFSSLSKQPEGNISVEDIPSGFSLPLDDQPKTTTGDPSHVEGRVGDDSFDQWNDFRILTDVKNNHTEPSTTTSLPSVDNSGPDVSDGWKDFIGSVGVGDPKAGGNDFGLLNVAQQDPQDIHADTPQSKTFSQDDSIGLWSTTMSTNVLEDQLLGSGTKSPAVGTTKGANESFDLWNDFKSSTVETQVGNNIEGADNKMSDKDSRTLDVWNDFASLGASNNEEQISKEKGSDGNSSNDKSFASSKDNSFNAWNDLTVPMGVSVSQSINNDISFGDWNDFSSSTVTHTDQHQSSSKKAGESQTVREDDDSFSSWSYLRGSGMQVENSFPSTIAMKSNQDQISLDKASGGLERNKDNSPFDAWGDFGHSLLMSDKQSQAGGIELSENKPSGDVSDFFSGWSESGKQSTNRPNDKLNSNGVVARDGKSISENDDSFDAWGDFTTSNNAPVNQPPSSSANVPVVEEAVKQDDIFDSWNVFTSSSNLQAADNTMVPKESTQEISLLGTNTNAQGVEYTSSSQQELLLGGFSDRNGTSQEASSPPKVPDLVRTENGVEKADVHSEKISQSETTSRVVNSELKSSDVETLISEMHDLSFMLENSLSIPESGE